jgi:hypothetical protein
MLTALSALMIFQLKRHKLDDYRAKYRVWMMLSIAALFSSMDASTSALLLLGKSIDTWAVREVGYSGWSLVLASFATIVAMLGLRLCNELKSAPASLIFWLGGLLAWATSAVIGTGLLKTDWSQAQTDMIVGGAWLGGILSVFVASGIYLRHIYIQAQRRFVMRNGMIREGTKWRMPNLSLRRKPNLDSSETVRAAEEKPSRRQANTSERSTTAASVAAETQSQQNRAANSSRELAQSSERKTESSSSEAATIKERRLPRLSLPKIKLPALRLPKWHSDPKLGDDYSDVDADTRLRDQGFDAPMPKKPGWFSKRSSVEQNQKTPTSPPSTSSARSDTRAKELQAASLRESNQDAPDFSEVASDKKRWWSLSRKNNSSGTAKTSSSKPNVNSSKTSSISKSPLESAITEKAGSTKPKKSWSLLPRSNKGVASSEPASKASADKPAQKIKKKWFGLLDGLKLKPPSDSTLSNKSATTDKGQSSTSSSKPIGPPSSSSASRYDPPPQSKSTPPIQVNRTASAEPDDEEDDDQSNRGLSRAERKRLRKQQQENRRAA